MATRWALEPRTGMNGRHLKNAPPDWRGMMSNLRFGWESGAVVVRGRREMRGTWLPRDWTCHLARRTSERRLWAWPRVAQAVGLGKPFQNTVTRGGLEGVISRCCSRRSGDHATDGWTPARRGAIRSPSRSRLWRWSERLFAWRLPRGRRRQRDVGTRRRGVREARRQCYIGSVCAGPL